MFEEMLIILFVMYILFIMYISLYVSLICYCARIAMIGFSVYANWKLFVKMGEPGWKSIVPVYNTIIKYKHIWSIRYGIISLVLGYLYELLLIVACFVMIVGEEGIMVASIAIIPTAIVFGFFSIVLYVEFCIRYAKAFGRSVGYAVGLIFLPFVFTMILAFGKSKYIGNSYYPEPSADASDAKPSMDSIGTV